ncbi:ATP/GTP-binding protein [Streptomyces sp. NPDC002817]|uniref:ATP/GTP-binding protein n=1 Tax=Streptomyces sp. NPDC088357 TaxID=3154655 RepID=UPI003433E55C
MLIRHRAIAALASTLVVASAATAQAADNPDIDKGTCGLLFCVGVGTEDKSDGQNGQGSNAGQDTSGDEAPDCTYQAMDPQPPPGSKHYQGGKIVYEYVCDVDGDGLVEIGAGADQDGAPPVDPAVVAQQAVDKMKLAGPDVASPRAAGKYTVGVPVWMWVNQSATTYGPNTASATAGGVTVTATARVSKIVWQMGDGTTVTCTGPGTAYQASDSMAKSPTCGHVYTTTSAKEPGDKFTLSATSTWTINWQVTGGGGEAGQLTETRQSQIPVAIGELQVVR